MGNFILLKRAKKEKWELVYCANNDKGKTRRPFQ